MAALLLVAATSPLFAQDAGNDNSPAFSLASSHTFTTKERPAISLTFRRVTFLDFRVYKVNDALKFFSQLRDPHELGSPEPIVPQERTLLERLAAWKADRRDEVFTFLRRQVTREYRAKVREQSEQKQVQQRQTIRYTTFAQVPLLNPTQLVASWREVLPPVREAEARRIPLEVNAAGVYVVEAVNAPLRAYTIVMVSDLGLVTKTAPGQIIVFAANRFSGQPVSGCQTQTLLDQKVVGTATTGDDGLGEVPLPAGTADSLVAVAQCGNQIAASDPGAWFLEDKDRSLVGYVYTDKPIYRPGQTVRFKSILRWKTRGALAPFDAKDVEVAVSDSNDKVVLRERRPVDAFGSVLANFSVPAGAALGYYTIQINTGDEQAQGSFEVQEYRKPEFDVNVTPGTRFFVQGATISATIQARYYFGQPVAGGTVKYVVHQAPYFSPYRYTDDVDEEQGGEFYDFAAEQQSEETTTLDNDGNATIEVPTEVDENHRDYAYRIEARVTDASGREVSGRAQVVGTYGSFLLGARADQYVYRRGAGATVRIKAVNYTGAPQANARVSVVLEKMTGDYSNRTATAISNGTVQTDAGGNAAWSATLPDSGDYRFRASATSGDRTVTTETSVWVPGGEESTVEEYDRFLELVSDKASYQPGDVAKLLVRGEEFETAVLVTKESDLVSYRQVARVRFDQPIEVPVTPDDVGDTFVNIAFLKDDRLFRAEKRLRVPPVSRQLNVTVSTDKNVARPQQPGVFTIKTANASGQPVRAQVSLAVIDEAVYGVKPDDTPDPVRFFYRREYSRVSTQFSRDYSFVGYSGRQQLLLAQRRRPFTLADFKNDRPSRPPVRKDFPDAIFWGGDIVTDATGTATVRVSYPDSLTTWRLTARAVTEDTQLGGAVARTMTTKDLILRVVTPRFLTEGDTVGIPAIVHNYLPEAQHVDVSVQAEGLEATDTQSKQILDVPTNGEGRIDWRFNATRPGRATIGGKALTGVESDALELSVPVLPFGLKREVGASGSFAGAGERAADLTIPEASNPAARTIEVSLAPSLAGSLFGALDFLTSYPYGCTEQTLSSVLPNVMVARALIDMKLTPTERMKSLDRQISDGLTRLYDYQHEDGGWGWWKTDENHPFMTAYALYGLLELARAGYKVDLERANRAVTSLAAQYAKYPRAVPDLKAYMSYVIALAATQQIQPSTGDDGYKPAEAVDALWSVRSKMSPYGRALLLLTLDLRKDARGDELARTLTAEAQSAGDLSWWKTENDPLLEDYSDTSVEATATIVRALATRNPNDPILEKAVRWLLLNRNAGAYWSSTKQTAMVLYGLVSFMKARSESPQPFSVDVIVNGQPAGTRSFTPADWTRPDAVVLSIPAKAGANNIRIVKHGEGSVYWSATARYFYNGAALEPTGSRKLAVVRRYFSLAPVRKDDRIVYRETPFSGSARVGDLVLVRLTMAGSKDWRYLMLEDPLPAGAEAVAKDDAYELEKPVEWWYGSQREYRDDRTLLFQESFEDGRYEFVYMLKIISPGTFKAMPSQISAMYVPGAVASGAPQTFTVDAGAPAEAGAR